MSPATSLGPIVRGPDGALWFTELNRNQIGRVTTSGQLSQFAIPTPASNPVGIAAGPDGRIWFTEADKAAIGAVSTSGMVTEYPLASGTDPFAITAGPDGRLWFTALAVDQSGNLIPEIGAITTGGAASAYQVPGVPEAVTITVQSITDGPDGRLWFTEEDQAGGQYDAIGAITTGGVVSQYALPGYKSLTVGPAAIISGSDGRLWFTTDNGGTGLGAITTTGAVSYLTGPEVSGQPVTLGVSEAQCVVPSVVGLTLRAARTRLAHDHCRLGRVTHRRAPGKPGRVLAQRPKPGRGLPANAAVAVTERTKV